MPFCSLRAPLCWPANYGATLQMETKNALGKQSVTGTAVKMPTINYLTAPVILVNLTSSKTVDTEVNAIRITFTLPATPEHEQVSPWPDRVWLRDATGPKPVSLLKGQTLGCRYDMPVQGFNLTESLKQMNIVWNTEKTGNIRCAVGVKAADIPAPFTLTATPPATPPAPLVPPPVVPGPGTQPGTTPTLSADGTLVSAPLGSVVTAEGTWTFGPTTSNGSPLMLNGQNTGGGFGDKLLVKNGGKLYTFSRAGDWWAWSNGWTKMTTAP
jgi:hypothetical protein